MWQPSKEAKWIKQVYFWIASGTWQNLTLAGNLRTDKFTDLRGYPSTLPLDSIASCRLQLYDVAPIHGDIIIRQ